MTHDIRRLSGQCGRPADVRAELEWLQAILITAEAATDGIHLATQLARPLASRAVLTGLAHSVEPRVMHVERRIAVGLTHAFVRAACCSAWLTGRPKKIRLTLLQPHASSSGPPGLSITMRDTTVVIPCICCPIHMLKHNSAWRVEQREGGVLIWTSPLGRTYIDRPPPTLRFVPT